MPPGKTLPPLLLALFAAISSPAEAEAPNASPVPPLPTYKQMPLPGEQPMTAGKTGELVWIDSDPDRYLAPNESSSAGIPCLKWPVVMRRWNPATGAFSRTPLPFEGVVWDQVAVPQGIMFVTASGCRDDRHRIALLTAEDEIVTADIQHRFFRLRMVALTDESVALVGREEVTRHLSVHVVRRQGGALNIERMPDLAVPMRDDFAEVALADGRLMVLGGSDTQHRGCSPCRADTHILDPKTKTWDAGPLMLEPRSEHSASRLPDGSILVTGGWTPSHGWGHGPSRNAERWDPATNTFEAIAPMPSGTARHRGVWMTGQEGKTLLIAAGTSAGVHAFDVQTRSWKTAGAARQGSEGGACAFVPFALAGNAYAWRADRSERQNSSECLPQQYWEVAALRVAADDKGPPASPPPPSSEAFLTTNRSGAAFVPATAGKPALMIGGTGNGGWYLFTAAVEAIGQNGNIWPLPTLNEPRSEAIAFRMRDGVLVAKGLGGKRSDRERDRPTLPMEWLATDAPESKAKWVDVAGTSVALSSALGQLADGSLIEVDTLGKVNRLGLVLREGESPSVERSEWATLTRPRYSLSDRQDVRIRGLSDGRIVVAGGQVQTEKIALLKPDSNRGDAIDEYIGIGEYLPSRRHEIYDPASGRWRTSAPSLAAGGPAAILDDGRVLKIGALPGDGTTTPRYLLEISSSDGTSWTTMPVAAGSKMKLSDKSRPFVLDGELFLSGELGSVPTGGRPSGVEWFNAATAQWEVLWKSGFKDNRDHAGRMLVRRLANGKVVVLPVEGF